MHYLLRIAGFILCCSTRVMAQQGQSIRLSLEEAVNQAQHHAPAARLAQTRRTISYFEYQAFRSEQNPQIFINGNIPSYSKEYFAVRQPDGTIKFQSIKQNNANIGISLNQKIPFSGGELSLNSDLTRFDDFKSKYKQYNTTPVYIRLTQPLFGFNENRWLRKTAPLTWEASRREYAETMESIAQEAARLFFDVLEAQTNILIAAANLRNTEVNFAIEKERIRLGTTTEERLLQLELQALVSRQDLDKASYTFEVAQLNLKIYTGNENVDSLLVQMPDVLPKLTIPIAQAVQLARAARSEYVNFEIRKIEARRDMAQSDAARHQINLFASYGFNNASANLDKAFRDMNDQQRFIVGFSIPIVDWGRRKSRYNMAKATEELIASDLAASDISLRQQIVTLAGNIGLLHAGINLARKTDSVALRRFDISTRLYQMGKLSLTELNLAQSEKDQASRGYVQAMRAFWDAYYLMRRLTLFDFSTQTNLYEGK